LALGLYRAPIIKVTTKMAAGKIFRRADCFFLINLLDVCDFIPIYKAFYTTELKIETL
jgi:hypothetical protein